MVTDQASVRGSDDGSSDDLTAFLNLLNELKATGCSLLVVGDAPREVFTRASGRLLGDDDVMRHRVLGVTDASARSIADRLPDPSATPRPLTETTHVINHAGAPRSVTAAADPGTPPKLAGIEETCVADPELRGLESALCEATEEVAERAYELRPADLRVCIDSLVPLLDRYDADVVSRCLEVVGSHVRDHDGMAHYVLPARYDSDAVQTLLPAVDAAVELRTADPDAFDHDARQRWHVPRRGVTTDWMAL